jgi:HAD superfamily hydrolase (TIGR01450 family)
LKQILKKHLKQLPSAFILDMDGTFFLGDALLPGALELLDWFNVNDIKFTFLTNNTSRGKQDYVGFLTRLGVKDQDARIYTAGDATVSYLRAHYPGKKVFLVGTQSLRFSFEQEGIDLVQADPDVLVLGYDTELTYQKLVDFSLYLRRGLPYIATHPDLNCPSAVGPLPDIGSFMALLETSAGRVPDVILGKPNPGIVQELAKRWGLATGDMLMIGDRLYTDIALGKTSGVQTALVLSGETKREDLANSIHQPNLVFENLADLLQYLTKLSNSQETV